MKFLAVLFVLGSVAVIGEALPQQLYAAPPEESYGAGGGSGGGQKDISRPAQYSYSYETVDEPSGNQYAHGEQRDGDQTQGEYRVLLPDGRTQIVSYTVTAEGGFVANVYYEGDIIAQNVGSNSGYQQPPPSTGFGGYQV